MQYHTNINTISGFWFSCDFLRNANPPSPVLLQPSKLLWEQKDSAVVVDKTSSGTSFGGDHRRTHMIAQHPRSKLENDIADPINAASHFSSKASEQGYARKL